MLNHFKVTKFHLIKNINHSLTLNKLPPLIKGYLRPGGMVSENFYIDAEFETIDYCVIMLTEKIVSRYQNKFLNYHEK